MHCAVSGGRRDKGVLQECAKAEAEALRFDVTPGAAAEFGAASCVEATRGRRPSSAMR